MCPACLTAAATVFAGATSAGGLAAFVVKKLGGRPGEAPADRTAPSQGDDNGSTDNRDAR
jgi:hypothetical protein